MAEVRFATYIAERSCIDTGEWERYTAGQMITWRGVYWERRKMGVLKGCRMAAAAVWYLSWLASLTALQAPTRVRSKHEA